MFSRYGIFKPSIHLLQYLDLWIVTMRTDTNIWLAQDGPHFYNPLIAITGLLGEFDDAARCRFVGREIAIGVVLAQGDESAVHGRREVSREDAKIFVELLA